MKGAKVEMFRAVDIELVRGLIRETQGVFLRYISLSETLMDEGEYIAWSEAVPEPHSAWLEVRVTLGWTRAEVYAIAARIGRLMDELFKLASTCVLSGTSAPLHREIERLQALSAEWTELVRDDDRLV